MPAVRAGTATNLSKCHVSFWQKKGRYMESGCTRCMYMCSCTTICTRLWGDVSPVNFQSVIDKPERVSLVIPPSTTMLNTQPEHPASQKPICLRALLLSPAVCAAAPVSCCRCKITSRSVRSIACRQKASALTAGAAVLAAPGRLAAKVDCFLVTTWELRDPEHA